MVEKQNIVIDKILQFIKLACARYKIDKVLLFGSYALSTANSNSDIDVALIINDGQNDNSIEITKNLFLIAYKIDARIEPKCIFRHEIEEMEPASILAEILRTGIEIDDSSIKQS